MSRLCERPGCSETGSVAYGMVPEDLLFWISPLDDAPVADPNVLCRRHADAMVVPRGWTLDDLREDVPRLFKPSASDAPVETPRPTRRRRHVDADAGPQQLQIDGTGELDRPDPGVVPAALDDDGYEPWQPEFDAADDLDGLLEVTSPLLARAFRGTDRPKQ